MPTISDRLNEIICRYRIDSGFPEFKKYCEAVKLISSFFERFTNTDTVMLIATKDTDLKYLRSHMECAATIKKVKVDFLKSINKSMFESNTAQKIVVVSYTGHREVCHELSLKGIPHESLYEYFAENGLILQHDYYDFILSTYFNYTAGKPGYDFAHVVAYREIYYEKKAYALAKGMGGGNWQKHKNYTLVSCRKHKPIDVFVIPQDLLSRSEITSELAESSAQVIDLQDFLV